MMPQSHTSLSCYTTCPRQYEAKYVTKEVKFEPVPLFFTFCRFACLRGILAGCGCFLGVLFL